MTEEVRETKVIVRSAVDRPDFPVVAVTPGSLPNVCLVPMSAIVQVGVRVLRTYFQSLLGFLLAVGSGLMGASGLMDPIPAGDFAAAFNRAAGLALAPTVVALLQNVIELLARVDQQHPQWRA
ncbi:MAG: hypothetical protein HY329_13825 [Chloroflexi bacterium]|nr:hypothetical protein [Chloroflexota bacterium]